MKKDDISRLLERYLSARLSEKEPYFDADEVDELLNSFEDSDDYTYYDEVLELGMKLHPGNMDLQMKYCRQLIFNEKYDEALAMIDSFGETDNPDLDMLRMECYCPLGQYFEKVVPFLEAKIEASSEFTEGMFEYIATLLNDLDLLPAADHLINWGLKLYPDNQILKDEYCFTLESENKIPEAIAVCNELIDKNPFSYDYWFMLGRLYSLSGDYEKAIDAFDFALTCDDSSDELKLLRAYCLYMNDSFEKALEAYEELAVNPVIRNQTKLLMAECYIQLDAYEKAYTILHDVIEENDPVTYKDYTIYSSYIKCCIETDHREEIVAVLEQAIERFPDNLELLSELGYDLVLKGESELAEMVLVRYRLLWEQLPDKEKEKTLVPDCKYDPNEPMPWDELSDEKPILSEELVREFLKNKENKN